MSIYDFKVTNIKGDDVSLASYQGKVLLIFNSATKCGLTPQYEGIENLYEAYKDQGFDVLDFPCNQFMNQAPGTDEELASFCQLKFHTKFQTFSKIKVNGKDAHPLYKYMKNVQKKDFDSNGQQIKKPSLTGSAITWNFAKFLINRQGEVVYRFSPTTQPEDLKPIIERMLKDGMEA